MSRTQILALAGWLTWSILLANVSVAAPIAVEEVKREGAVDFEKEILPLFRRSCLACHNASDAEGKLVMENPAAILKGGSEGPAVVAGKSAESLLMKLATHAQEPFMPPPDNDVKAKPLTPAELGLIKRWIDEGAKGNVAASSGPIVWQALPPGLNPVYAVAASPDGHYAAAARANQVFLYHVPSKREIGRLTDPALITQGIYKQPGVADLDIVQSLRFSPDGRYLASGGFRTLKLWRRPEPIAKSDIAGITNAKSSAISNDGKLMAVGEESGSIKILATDSGQIKHTLSGHSTPVTGLAFSADGTKLLSGSLDKTCRLWNLADNKEIGVLEIQSPITSVAFIHGDKQIATGEENKNVSFWELPVPKADQKEAPKPLKQIAHGGAIVSLTALADGTKLVSGSAEGAIKVIDVASGNASKNYTHGSAIVSAGASPDGKRIASLGANSLKIFSTENDQLVAEQKGDFRTKLDVAYITQDLSLAKKNVEQSKKDFEEAQKRKTAEEDNLKKAKEEITKSEAEVKTKTEAAKQPSADKAAAEKTLADATAAKTTAEATKKTADETQAAAQTKLQGIQPMRDAAVKAAAETEKQFKMLTEQVAKAKQAADKEPVKPELADALKKAEAAAKEAETKNQTAQTEKTNIEKQFSEAEAAKKMADETKQQADKKLTESTTAFNMADQKLKQILPNAQKAIDEQTSAERNLKAAQRSLERGTEAVKKATDTLPEFEKVFKQFEETAKQTESRVATTQKAATDAEKPWYALAFSADSLWVAVAGETGQVQVFSAETGAARELLPSQNAPIATVRYTPTGLISLAKNNTGKLWELPVEWKLERTIGNPNDATQIVDRVTAIDFTHDNKFVASGSGEPSRSGEIKIWSVENGQLSKALKEPHSDAVFSLEFSPDDTQLASSAADRFVKLFKVADGSFVRSFEGHTHHVTGVSWRADGRVLASCGADAVVKIWDIRSGEQQRTIQGLTKEATSLRFVAEGENVLVSGGANLVRMLNSANGGNVRDFPGSTDYMYSVATSRDGKIIVAGGQDSVVRIWNENGQAIATFTPPTTDAAVVAHGK